MLSLIAPVYMSESRSDFGKRIVELRRSKDMNQREVSEKTGIPF